MEHFEHSFMHPEVWPYLKPYSLSIPMAGKGKRNNCVLWIAKKKKNCCVFFYLEGWKQRGISLSPLSPAYLPFLFILGHHLSSYFYDHRGLGQQQASENLCSCSAGNSLKNRGKIHLISFIKKQHLG